MRVVVVVIGDAIVQHLRTGKPRPHVHVAVDGRIDADKSRSLRIGETIRAVDDDASRAQAQTLLHELHGHVADISRKLDAVDERNRRAQRRGSRRRDPMAGALRRELGEAHQLIDGLRRRFPAVVAEGSSEG